MAPQPIVAHAALEARWAVVSAALRFVRKDYAEDIELLARSRRQIAESHRLLALTVYRLLPQPKNQD